MATLGASADGLELVDREGEAGRPGSNGRIGFGSCGEGSVYSLPLRS